MKKLLAIVLCLALVLSFCGFALRSEDITAPDAPAEQSGEAATDPADEPTGEQAEESAGEGTGAAADEATGEPADEDTGSSDEITQPDEAASEEAAASDEPSLDGAAKFVYVNGVYLTSGTYLASNSATAATDGFVYGTTTDYVAGYASGVLYLNNATVTEGFYGSWGYTGIYTQSDLTIVLIGKNSVSDDSFEYAIEAGGKLTMRGTGSLDAYGYYDGIVGDKGLTIESGTINATTDDFDGLYAPSGDIVISAGAVVTAAGDEAGICAYDDDVTISAGAVVTATGGYVAIWSDSLTIKADTVLAGWSETDAAEIPTTTYTANPEDYQYMQVAPSADGEVWINNVCLTDGEYLASNSATAATDGFVYGTTTGYVAGYQNGVLYLNNAAITVPYCDDESDYDGIYSDYDLTIVLIGDNTIANEMIQYGVWSYGSLTISGEGSLTVSASRTGIGASKSLSIEGGVICAAGGYGALFAGYDMNIYSDAVLAGASATDAETVDTDVYTEYYNDYQYVRIPGGGVWVNNVYLMSGEYLASNSATAVTDGFVYGTTTGYVAGYQNGVLYLNNAAITVPYLDYENYYNGVYSDYDLTIVLVGDNTIANDELEYGIWSYGSLTISGEGSLTVSAFIKGIGAYRNLSIEDGTICAAGGYGALSAGYYMDIYSDAVLAGESATDAEPVDTDEYTEYYGEYQYVRIPGDGVWVNDVYLYEGTYLASNSATEVTKGFVYGTTTDYVAGYADGVLYLNGASVTVPHEGSWAYTGIYADDDLIIELIGDNSVSDESFEYAIHSDGKLTIRGAGSLTAYGTADGFLGYLGITVEGGTINATSDEYDGLYATYGNIVISGGTVNAVGGEAGIAAYCGSVTISGSAVVTAFCTESGEYDYAPMAILASGGISIYSDELLAGSNADDAAVTETADYVNSAADYLYVHVPYLAPTPTPAPSAATGAKSPATGDANSPLVWLAVLVLSSGAVIALLPKKTRE